jgi:hypothetical protein
MINGWTRLNMYSKLAWQINILHSISINMIIIVSITRTLNRLDIMNDKIRSREWYLTIVDVVDGGGNADGVDDRAKSRSSMSSGGTFPLTIPRAWRRRRRRADAVFGRRAVMKDLRAVARRALPKNLIRILPVQDRKDEGSGDLLSQTPVHADDRDRETTAVAQ